jgi:subtilisin family serine protease
MSGTSMASPHIAGLAAYLIGKDGPSAPDALCQKIQTLSTKNAIDATSIPQNSSTVNYLAFNGISA